MNTPIFKDKKFKSDDPTQAFRVPEGYFDRIHSNIMARIAKEDSVAHEALQQRSTLDVLRPYLYLAAMFVGLTLIINLIPYVNKLHKTDNAPMLTATTKGIETPLTDDITDEEYELFLWEDTADEFIASSISESY